MKTVLILMAQFGPRVAIPVEDVRREYFSHLELDKFLEKIARADIPLPVTRVDKSRRTAKFIGMVDLAMYLDAQMEAGRKEYEQMKAAAGSGPDGCQRFADLMFKRR
ncbi:Pyocin activator protein PrtN [Paraburkholderia sp. RP-4-7]|uniref:Pyocin activator protein PrtN n=1 Tax=Paraburkholderia polaris TaxID=2728848 RepID=A0A848IB29_9BURK|nr:pyocin activator PrtN family protein [Paraburkholderia polaris]NML98780.1 Pyocin activator protein PrtN [Paraburkholderia polaris]